MWAGGPHRLFSTFLLWDWCGLVARTGFKYKLAGGLVRVGGPHPLLVQFGLGIGAGWWPAPAFEHNLAFWDWCGLVARTGF